MQKRLDPQHAKEALAVYGAHFTGEKGEPVKTSTMSDVLEESAKWLAVDLQRARRMIRLQRALCERSNGLLAEALS